MLNLHCSSKIALSIAALVTSIQSGATLNKEPEEASLAPSTTADVIAASAPPDWRTPDPKDTLYLEFDAGRVVIELAADFAPKHVANIRALVKAHYFDGLAITRVDDNYVVQWGGPINERRWPAAATRLVTAEFDRKVDPQSAFNRLPDGDVYAPEVGISNGFPVARDPAIDRMWLAHCYSMVGIGRTDDPRSGSGGEMYVVIGHAPRHLDRNAALIGRVLKGMELLSSLPRGTGDSGVYDRPEQRAPIKSIRFASELPPEQRTALEVMRTHTAEFDSVIESRRNRRNPWTSVSPHRVDLCNVPLPVREPAKSPLP